MRNHRHIEVRPIAGALGAEVHGVDISRELDDEVVGEICQAYLDHLVIFLRERKVTPHQQLPSPVGSASRSSTRSSGPPEAPMITPVVKLEHERNNFSGIWHPTRPIWMCRRWPACLGTRGAAIRWRHDVRQPVPRLRGIVRWTKQTPDGLIGVSSVKADVSLGTSGGLP